MKQVVVRRFGGPEVLEIEEVPTPEPGPGQVRVRVTSIGLNHAELMGRRGAYKLSTGEPPFVPGLEGGGVIEAVGSGVDAGRVGERVVLSPAAPRKAVSDMGGTYRTHYVLPADHALPAPPPAELSDEALGTLWLAFLTAWGCLIWKQALRPGQIVALPAASSGVALTASQIARAAGATTIGLTTSPQKVEALKGMAAARFDHLVVTHEAGKMLPWHREMRQITQGKGVDVFFDPVAAGPYLDTEIKCLGTGGTIWVYGLLGEPGVVDVTPLIRKQAAIRGWGLTEMVAGDEGAWRRGCREILDGFARGEYQQQIAATYPFEEVQRAHEEMEKGRHIGKLVLVA